MVMGSAQFSPRDGRFTLVGLVTVVSNVVGSTLGVYALLWLVSLQVQRATNATNQFTVTQHPIVK